MTFLHPLGLLGLIGVPIIILIYVLKNKYVEQIIPTTYIWTLSERFLRRRNPFSKIAGIISLILQLLLVVIISLTIAHPTFTLEGAASNYTFIIDGSGSMNATLDGEARLERGKEEVKSIIRNSYNGSRYSCIYVADKTAVVFEGESDKEKALRLVDGIEPTDAVASFNDAIAIAQGYFNADPSTRTYLITDKSYEKSDNIEVINLSGRENNVSLSEAYIPDEIDLSVKGSVISHLEDTSVTVAVYIDEAKTAISTVELALIKGVAVPFDIPLDVDSYYSIEVRILEEDSLLADNSAFIYSTAGKDNFKALIVSELPFFISSALRATSDIAVEHILPSEYEGAAGYDLYVFDSYTPYELPKDGAIWIFNPVISTAGSGFSVQGKFTPDEAVEVDYSTSTNTQVKKLLSGLSGAPIHVTEYVKCGIYDGSFRTLMSHKGNPILFVGANSYGNREAVFAFDLHESDLVGYSDWIALVDNLVEYSFPTVIEQTSYTVGDSAAVNVISGCSSILATSPSGKVTSLSLSGTVAELTLTDAGVYKIECIVNGNSKDYYIFSAFPEEETLPEVSGGELSLLGEAKDGGIDGIYDNLTVLFILLALVFTADWAVYCYEKYQLR
jgi:hypothetical protein